MPSLSGPGRSLGPLDRNLDRPALIAAPAAQPVPQAVDELIIPHPRLEQITAGERGSVAAGALDQDQIAVDEVQQPGLKKGAHRLSPFTERSNMGLANPRRQEALRAPSPPAGP